MTSERAADNRQRAESFGGIAAAYDTARPGYPAELIDVLTAAAPTTALDVGCGTGIAARLLQARGVDVLGVEVDDRMAALARRRGLPVETAAFERWADRGRRFDLVYSAQAWHWVHPEEGPATAARVLAPGGRLALFWNFIVLPPRVHAELESAYRLTGAVSSQSVLRGYGPQTLDALAADLQVGGFAPVQRMEFEWQQRYDRDRWLDLVGTHSDHLQLPAAQRTAVSAAVGAAIDRVGGELTATYRTYLLLTTRRAGG